MTLRRLSTGLLFLSLIVSTAFGQEFEQVNTTSPQTLTNKTLTSPTLTSPSLSSPVLSGTATGTYSLGGSPSLIAAVLSGTMTGTYTLAGVPTISSPIFSGSITGVYSLAGTPTLIAPILSGTATGTYTLAGTPTIASPIFSGTSTGTYTLGGTATLASPIFSGTSTGTYTISGTPTILDNVLRVSGSADTTKKLAFEVDGFTTGTTRTLTPPNADLTLPAITAAGDLPVASASGVLTNLAVGSAGTVPMSRTAASTKLVYVPALSKAIYGLTYDNGTDAVNDLNINVGGAMDATGAYWMTLGTALGKQSDVNWVVGGTVGVPAGGLDTGVVGNNDYYVWLIARSDTGIVDALYSLSSTAPTMPANYDFKRLIGWIKRVGGTVVALTTYETEGGGLEMMWNAPTLDIDLSNTLTTTRRTDAVKVPLNFSVTARLHVLIADATTGPRAIIYCPDQSDLVPSGTATSLFNSGFVLNSAAGSGNLMFVRTSATGTVAARADLATVDNYRVSTQGFTWARRN